MTLNFIMLTSVLGQAASNFIQNGAEEVIFRGAAALASIFAGFSLLHVLMHYFQGTTNSINFTTIIRPILMVILVANFQTLVLQPWQWCAGHVAALCETGAINQRGYFSNAAQTALNNCATKVIGKDNVEGDKGKSVVGRVIDGSLDLSAELEKFVNKLKVKGFCGLTGVTFSEDMENKDIPLALFILALFAWIANWLMYIVQIAFTIYSKLFLYILGIMGVISFTIGTLNAFKDSIKTWMASYLKVSLWLPLFHLCCSFIYGAAGSMMTSSVDISAASLPFIEMIATFFILKQVVFKIDTMSDMIVSGGSNAGAGIAGESVKSIRQTIRLR